MERGIGVNRYFYFYFIHNRVPIQEWCITKLSTYDKSPTLLYLKTVSSAVTSVKTKTKATNQRKKKLRIDFGSALWKSRKDVPVADKRTDIKRKKHHRLFLKKQTHISSVIVRATGSITSSWPLPVASFHKSVHVTRNVLQFSEGNLPLVQTLTLLLLLKLLQMLL